MTGRRMVATALAVVLIATVAPSSGASAAPVIPSVDQIDEARQTAGDRARQVQAIKADLSSAQADLDRTRIAVAVAGQAYDAALLKLATARTALSTAQAANRSARADVVAAQRAVGELVRSQVQGDAGLLQWASLLDGGSPQDVIEQASVFSTVSASLDGLEHRLTAAQRVAAARQKTAQDAEAAVERAAGDAARTKDAAERAATVASDTVSSYAARRDQLLVDLAQAEQVTITLVRQRQDGLEALARARAEARRRAAEAALRRREAAERAAEARAAARARAEAAAERAAERRAAEHRAAEHRDETAGRGSSRHHSSFRSRSSTRPTSSGSSGSSPGGSSPGGYSSGGYSSGGYSAGAARKAIAYAHRQLGKPYVFGATGPDTFDCSGLTMRAWQAAGRDIPRLAASQYLAIQHISAGDLRPGDLLFWGDSPSSIYHVALYIGGGEMIQAPRPGRSVEIQSIYYWISPSYYGRV